VWIALFLKAVQLGSLVSTVKHRAAVRMMLHVMQRRVSATVHQDGQESTVRVPVHLGDLASTAPRNVNVTMVPLVINRQVAATAHQGGTDNTVS